MSNDNEQEMLGQDNQTVAGGLVQPLGNQEPPPIPSPAKEPEEGDGESETENKEPETAEMEEGANVKLSGLKKPFTENGVINIGQHTSVEMPSEAQQRAGWKCDEAMALFNQFPDLYKPITDKERRPVGGNE